MGKANTIANSPELRLKGWRAALRSRRTLRWLRPALKASIRRLARQPKRRERRKSSGVL